MRRGILTSILALGLAAGVQAQDPLIEFSPAGFTVGDRPATVINGGTQGGQFTVLNGSPVAGTVSGEAAVTFSNDTLQSTFDVPAAMLGNNAWTVHARVYNPSIGSEEYVVHWANRGGPNNTNAALAYGTNGSYGAVQHWGGADMPYAGGPPAAGQWHDIVVTFDGALESLYVDGVLNSTEAKTLNIAGSTTATVKMRLGMSNQNSQPLSGSISMVQTFGSALSAAQVADIENQTGALVKLDASGLAAGIVTSWANTGSLGGSFDSVYVNPIVETVGGETAFTFDGTNGYWSENFYRPPELAGNNPWTVFVRAWNPSIQFEEVMVEWAARGTTAAYAYVGFGSAPDWGAAAHWGAPDMGYATLPTTGTWHNIAVVFDGTQERIYVDGVLNTSETKTLNIGNNSNSAAPIYVGSSVSGSIFPTLSIAALEMYGSAMTEAEVQAWAPVGPTAGEGDADVDVTELALGQLDPLVNPDEVSTATVTITNNGTKSLNFVSVPNQTRRGIVISGENAARYSIDTPSASFVAPIGAGQTFEFVVRLTPTFELGGDNSFEATMTIHLSDPDQGSYEVTLSGTSVPVEMDTLIIE